MEVKLHMFAMILIQLVTKASLAETTCQDAGYYLWKRSFYSKDMYPWDYHSSHIYHNWLNTTFWGGYEQIAWKDDIGPHCWNRNNDKPFLVLSERHPQKTEINATAQNLQACMINQAGVCVANVTVGVVNCDGNLMYRFLFYDDGYICFDRIYTDACNKPALSLPAGPVDDSVSLVQIDWTNIELGWYDSRYDGQNYTIPLIKDTNSVSELCYAEYVQGLYKLETQPESVGETAVGMRVCFLSDYEYDYYYDTDFGDRYWHDCDYHVFIRSCNGTLQFDLSLIMQLRENICFVRANNVKVIPESRHTVQKVDIGGKQFNQYTPYLQYRCSFQMTETHTYRVKWFINDEFLTEKGPANNAEELILKENDLKNTKLGYTVKCSVLVTSRKRSTSDLFEHSSEDFFAGFKVSDPTIRLSKTETKMASVEVTVPLGCTYNDADPINCQESLTLNDLNNERDICSDGVLAVNANDVSKQVHTIKSLMQNEKWQGSTSHNFRLGTIDRTYDDKDNYKVNIQRNGVPVTDENTEDIKVAVTNWRYSKNRMCYSHVDPHMRTGNLREYEQQREGDYMLYRNQRYQIEVLERARYCVRGQSVVCACAVIVRAGADAFMINRCGGPPYEIRFIQCGDCGLLDVVRIRDNDYEIYTPIGTKVSVHLDRWRNGHNMNIEIYLTEKDFDETDGLCGWFDGTSANDFLMRNGATTSGNDDYKFSESWRLRPNENLFKDPNLKLKKWNPYTTRCFRDNSITKRKCSEINNSCFKRRSRRSTDKKILKMKHLDKTPADAYRIKRDIETNITDSEAEQICRKAVYNAPAVLEFPDKLAGENLSQVINQCVYDIIHGNDVSWAEAHIGALNNIAKNILNLNPVFKSNNSEAVEVFLSHTCENNCSDNGICSKDGLCNCTGVYRGYDCSIDIRIPPLIFDVRENGKCFGDAEEYCTCFMIKTDNIFDGFSCEITSFKMNFNGEREELGNSRHNGEYDDVYTGVCCAHVGRRRRSTEAYTGNEPFVYAYDISISNDGIHFGDISSVYLFDTTCLYLEEKTKDSQIGLKNGYCFIDDTCVEPGSTHQTGNGSECFVCDQNKHPYSWTVADCSQKDSGLSTVELIGIGIGSTLAVMLLIAALVCIYFYCCKLSKKARTVAVDIDSIAHVDSFNNSETTNASETKTFRETNALGASKPAFRRNMFVKEVFDEVKELKTGYYWNTMIIPNPGNTAAITESEQYGPETSPSVKSPCDQSGERTLSAVSLKIG